MLAPGPFCLSYSAFDANDKLLCLKHTRNVVGRLLASIGASTAQKKMAWMSKVVMVQEFADQSQKASTSSGTAIPTTAKPHQSEDDNAPIPSTSDTSPTTHPDHFKSKTEPASTGTWYICLSDSQYKAYAARHTNISKALSSILTISNKPVWATKFQ